MCLYIQHLLPNIINECGMWNACLVLSSTVLGERVGRTVDKTVLQASLSLAIWSSWPIPHLIHDVVLLIQDVLGLPRLRVPGMVPCIMSFSRHSPSLRITCPKQIWADFVQLLLSHRPSHSFFWRSMEFGGLSQLSGTYCKARYFDCMSAVLLSACPCVSVSYSLVGASE